MSEMQKAQLVSKNLKVFMKNPIASFLTALIAQWAE
jgi:hypothetical protein